jgi:hypothetical protein
VIVMTIIETALGTHLDGSWFFLGFHPVLHRAVVAGVGAGVKERLDVSAPE